MQLIDKHMDEITREVIKDLITEEKAPCVTFTTPTHREWDKTVQDPIRLKNLASEARDRLINEGMDRKSVEALLSPVADLSANREDFWRFQSDGLAIFLTPTRFNYFRVPIHFTPRTIVGPRLYIRPLLPLVEDGERCFVLALNLEGIRLFEVNRYHYTELPLTGFPTRLEEFLRFDDFERSAPFRTGIGASRSGGRTARFHGHGVAGDEAHDKQYILEFFRKLDNGIRNTLGESTAPMVLAGQPHLRGIYRDANHYRFLTRRDIDINPEDLSDTELARKAWEVTLQPLAENRICTTLNRFEEVRASEPGRATLDLEEVLAAAVHRRIATLFVARDQNAWGQFDPEEPKMTIQGRPSSGNEDLLNLAAAQTLLHGGEVYQLEDALVPEKARAAAILRY